MNQRKSQIAKDEERHQLQYHIASLIYERVNPGERFYEIVPERSPREANQDAVYRELADDVIAYFAAKGAT